MMLTRCEPEPDPDRIYEFRIENGEEIERDHDRAAAHVDQLPWEVRE